MADPPLPPAAARPAAARPVLAILADFPWQPGQAMRWVLEIAAAAADGFEVRLLTPEPWSRLRLLRLGAALGVPVADSLTVVTTAGAAPPPADVFVAFGAGAAFGAGVLPPAGSRSLLVLTGGEDAARAGAGDAPTVLVPSAAVAGGRPAIVLTPPSGYGAAFATDKEPLILTVGRFGAGSRHEALIDQLETGLAAGSLPAGTTLALAGVVAPDPDTLALFDQLRRRAQGRPVRLFPNASRRRLVDLYRRAAVFWPAGTAAAGQAFALTTIEAMSAGAVPVALAGSAAAGCLEPGLSGCIAETAAGQIALTGRILAEIATTAGPARCRAAGNQADSLSAPGFWEGLRTILQAGGPEMSIK